MEDNNKTLKKFFIKLISITLAVIVAFNIIFNLIFADRLNKLDSILNLSEKDNREQIKNKLRSEIQKGINKDDILTDEDAELLYQLYIKIKNEFEDIKSK